jgi:putative oxidoreductase
LRGVVGLIFAAHGSQKLFGWFGGPGLNTWTNVMKRMGLKPAELWAWISGLSEFAGGLLFGLGLYTPVAAAAMIASMAMAIVKVHWSNGFFNSNRGIEFNLTLIAVLVAVGLTGPGVYALAPQTLFGWSTDGTFIVTTLFGLLGVSAGLLMSLADQHVQHPA